METVKDWFKTNSVDYDFKKMENNVKFIAHIYKLCKEKINESRAIPYFKCEDETAIETKPEYDARRDVVWGYCGSIGENHKCEDNYVIRVGNDDDAYDQLVERMS